MSDTNKALQLSAHRAPDYVDVYANQLRIGTTVSDFTLVFGASDEGFTVSDQVSVRLAPGTLKMLFLNVKMALEAYEQAIGEIPVPSKLEQQISKNKITLADGLKRHMNGELGSVLRETKR